MNSVRSIKTKEDNKLKEGTKGIVIKTLHSSQLSLQNTENIVILHKYLLQFKYRKYSYLTLVLIEIRIPKI